ALAKTLFDQPSLPGKHLGRELAAIFAGHGAFDAFDDGRDRAAIIVVLLGAILPRPPGAPADILVVRGLVGVLEAAPAADVIDQHQGEIGRAGLNILDQLPERIAALDLEPALASIGIGAHDLDPARLGIVPDRVGLVFSRIFL